MYKKNQNRKHFGKKTLIGEVSRHREGFGFLLPDDPLHQDVHLSKKEMTGVMNKDRIQILVKRRGGRKALYSGKVLKIIRRFHTKVIGQCDIERSGKPVIRDYGLWGEDLYLSFAESLGKKPAPGEWVEADILKWPDHTRSFSRNPRGFAEKPRGFAGNPQSFAGRVKKVLGKFPKAMMDNMRVLQKHSIPLAFSEESLAEARAFSDVKKEDFPARKDLTDLPFVTIDGESAQDFDDAVYVKKHSLGQVCWTVYVGIADVSYYVPANSVLDKDAYDRGNSTYFPDFVAPMLPELLSKDLCSLVPQKERLAFVVKIQLNKDGEKLGVEFFEAIIKSQARLTYESVQKFLDGSSSCDLLDPVKESITGAENLTRVLLKNRMKEQFIQLELPEVDILLDQFGEPTNIVTRKRLFSHQLIEELMLLTNKSVAEHLKQNKTPSLYRVHDPPEPKGLKFLENFAGRLSFNENLIPPSHKKIMALLRHFAHHALSTTLQTLVLRSMSQASYSATQKLHFGLNFKHYTHFTSPIRRYSDLVVHRVLKFLLSNKQPVLNQKRLQGIAQMVTAAEQRSVQAERDILDIKKARFMKKQVGEVMEGVICSVTKFGFFVRLNLYEVEGMVHVDQLPGPYIWEEELLQLRSKRTGKRYSIGDKVTVQIASANENLGQIGFDLRAHKSIKF